MSTSEQHEGLVSQPNHDFRPEPPCECPGPGFCQRYQIKQYGHHWRLCSGNCLPERPCTEAVSQAMRRQWRKKLEAKLKGTPGPNILTKIANLTRAVTRGVAKNGAKVFQKVPLEVYEERRRICDSCDARNPEKDICTHPKCGCGLKRRLVAGTLSMLGKLEVSTEKCPMLKWTEYTGPTETETLPGSLPVIPAPPNTPTETPPETGRA